MINGQLDMDMLLLHHLQGLALPGGDPIPIFGGVPEEEVETSPRLPGLNVTFMHDVPVNRRHEVQPRLYRRVDPDDAGAGIVRIRPPTLRSLSYELTLYTLSYRDMLELSRGLLSRLRREFGSLTDGDGNEIIYRLEDTTDHARRIEEDRIFRRTFLFSFDAWVLDEVVDTGPAVKTIESVRTDFTDAHADELDIIWVPDEPEQEDS